MRIELGQDNWAEIAEVSEVTSGDVKAVRKLMKITIDEEGNRVFSSGEIDEMADEMLVRTVRNWSFPLPLPRDDRTSLDRLPPAAYEALKEAIDPHIGLLNARPNPTTSSGSSGG